jgi:asparagine synthetase B (glutamine-hydrolysing)
VTQQHVTAPSDQSVHTQHLIGLLSFAHEVYGQIAFASDVEPRSPFSDRRIIEFAVQAPLQAKLFSEWYKPLLRTSMAGLLPEAVRLRRDLGNHPGWRFYERLAATAGNARPANGYDASFDDRIRKWVHAEKSAELRQKCLEPGGYSSVYQLLSLTIFAEWLLAHPFHTDQSASQ